MKKLILTLTTSALLSAANSPHFYGFAGATSTFSEVVPSGGLGVRGRSGHHGFDLSATVGGQKDHFFAEPKLAYLAYFSKGEVSPYLGPYVSATIDRELGSTEALPNGGLILGMEKAYEKRILFWQLSASALPLVLKGGPFAATDSKEFFRLCTPTFSMGMSF